MLVGRFFAFGIPGVNNMWRLHTL